jgi:hypothetical protein
MDRSCSCCGASPARTHDSECPDEDACGSEVGDRDRGVQRDWARAVQRVNADGAQVVAADIDPRVAETDAGHARVVPMCGEVTADC